MTGEARRGGEARASKLNDCKFRRKRNRRSGDYLVMDDAEAGSVEVTGHFSSRPLCFALLQSSPCCCCCCCCSTIKKIARKKRERGKKRAILGDVFSEKNIGDRYPRKAEIRFSWNNFQATMNEARAFNWPQFPREELACYYFSRLIIYYCFWNSNPFPFYGPSPLPTHPQNKIKNPIPTQFKYFCDPSSLNRFISKYLDDSFRSQVKHGKLQ